MRDNIKTFTVSAARAFDVPEPILEVGSRPAEGQEGYSELRSIFSGARYIGADFLPGPSVDVLLDIHQLGAADGSLGTVVMMDTLEHVQDPILAMREAHRVLRDDGLTLIGSVMNFPIHNHPWDYWRFTPAAFDLILRPFAQRVVWYQGDPLAPHTVVGAARKGASPDATIAFESAIAALESTWPENAFGGPLLRFEPLLEAVVHDSARGDRTLPDLVAGRTVEQTFRCPDDHLARIDLKFRTGGRMNFCHVAYQVRDEATGQVVAERRYSAQHVEDATWTAFTFPAIAGSQRRDYRLIITSWDGREGAVLAPMLSDDPASHAEQLSVDSEYQPGMLCLRAHCVERGYRPADYRALTNMAGPLAPDAAGHVDEALRRISATHSAQLWQVASNVSDDVARLSSRIDALQVSTDGRLSAVGRDVEDILSFVRGLRSNVLYKAATGAKGLLRRRTGSERSEK
jgi:hypothetical protein